MDQALVLRLRLPAVLLLLLLGACETRSISNSGYAGRGNPFYKGELTEFDVLGVDVSRPASDAEIAQALDRHEKMALARGARLLVIQSGAPIPDADMVAALDRYFSPEPFSGVPLAKSSDDADDYSRALRLAAAKAGATAILCYWGVLESTGEGEPTKAVSWIPLVGQAVPDEAQYMRIRLKLALVDVRSGEWTMLAPKPFVDSALSAALTRVASDQDQVEQLKRKAYNAAVEALAARFAG